MAKEKSSLNRELTEAEVEKIRDEAASIETNQGTIGDIVRLAPLITVLVAVAGLIATLWKQIAESSRQRELDRDEREKGRLQRLDDQVRELVENLASTSGSIRAAAAVSIRVFMRPTYEDVHEQVFLLLLGALRFPRKDFSDKLLIRTFERAAGEQLPLLRAKGELEELDLSNCFLTGVRLDGFDLSGIDIGFADLHGADLSHSNLWRARGISSDLSGAHLAGANLGEARLVGATIVKARFLNANLVSTKLRGADGTGAIFRGAAMQEVQLDGAVLRGARFEGTNLNNAYFRGAAFDQGALRSIARGARNWRTANWDASVLGELEELSSESPA